MADADNSFIYLAKFPAAKGSPLRMPYTGVPFLWDSNTQSILFYGLVPNERGKHSFKY